MLTMRICMKYRRITLCLCYLIKLINTQSNNKILGFKGTEVCIEEKEKCVVYGDADEMEVIEKYTEGNQNACFVVRKLLKNIAETHTALGGERKVLGSWNQHGGAARTQLE